MDEGQSVEVVEADYENPEDEAVVMHDEDDDPQSHVGDETVVIEENTDEVL